MSDIFDNMVFLIPVYNEAESIPALFAEIRASFPDTPVCFINDCSRDGTISVLRKLPCHHLNLPANLGVGGAMQTGFRFAFEQGYDYAIRIDGDGQHPPAECYRLMERMRAGDMDVVVGSRFLGESDYKTSAWYRRAGISGLSVILSLACRRRITDPTSGFQMVNRAVLSYFSHQYPEDYPEPESLALLSRQGYRVCEVATAFRCRERGISSIQHSMAPYFLFKVGVALFVDRCRAVAARFDRHRLKEVCE